MRDLIGQHWLHVGVHHTKTGQPRLSVILLECMHSADEIMNAKSLTTLLHVKDSKIQLGVSRRPCSWRLALTSRRHAAGGMGEGPHM